MFARNAGLLSNDLALSRLRALFRGTARDREPEARRNAVLNAHARFESEEVPGYMEARFLRRALACLGLHLSDVGLIEASQRLQEMVSGQLMVSAPRFLAFVRQQDAGSIHVDARDRTRGRGDIGEPADAPMSDIAREQLAKHREERAILDSAPAEVASSSPRRWYAVDADGFADAVRAVAIRYWPPSQRCSCAGCRRFRRIGVRASTSPRAS